MKLFILFAACLVASVHSRESCINWVDDGSVSGSGQIGTSSGGGDNIIAKLFRAAGHTLAAAETAKSQILNQIIQAPASVGQGLISGAQEGISTAAQTAGNAAADLANNAQSAISNAWNSV